MKKWYCSTISVNKYELAYMTPVLEECMGIEKDGYKVEQIVYEDGQYQIFYSIVEEDADE